MTVSRPLFRSEVLEHHAGGMRPGEPLRLADTAARRALRVLVGLVVAAVTVALVTPVQETRPATVEGCLSGDRARIRTGSGVFILPAPDCRTGASLTVVVREPVAAVLLTALRPSLPSSAAVQPGLNG